MAELSEGLGSLMENKLLLQYMSGAGADISAGRPIGQNVNAITQQNISSQNFMKMLQKLLGKGVDFKSSADGKLTVSGEPGKVMELGGVEGAANAEQPSGEPNPLSPPPSPAMNSADLAGLTPEMISQALQFKFGQEEFEQKKLSDVADITYKQALTRQAEATTAAATPSISIPGTDIKLTNSQYIDWYKSANKDERTAAIKNFEYAQNKGYEGSFEEFQRESSTTHQKDFDRAKEDGYEGSFNEWMLEMAKAGAITIGEITGRAEAKADVDAVKYFTDPKGLSSDVDKYMKSEEVQNQLFEAGFDPEVKDLTTNEIKVKFIEDKIVSTGGSIEDVKFVNGKMSWTVKWPNGITETVSYGIGS